MQNIDSLAATGKVINQQRITRYDLSWSLTYGQHIEEVVDTDELPQDGNSVGGSYASLILASNPVHYYRLDETAGTVMTDFVSSSPLNGVYNVNAATSGFNLGGALYTDIDSAKMFNSSTWFSRIHNYNVGTPGTPQDFSIAFWFRPTTTSVDNDGMFEFSYGDTYGFRMWTHYGSIVLDRWTGVLGPPETINTNGAQCTVGQWSHVAVTVSAAGDAYVYLNGVAVTHKTFASGIIQPPTNTTFQISNIGDLSNIPDWGCDELAMFTRVLTASEIAEFYSQALSSSSGTGGTNLPYPLPPASDRTLPTLINAQDVSDLVDTWTVSKDAQNQTLACNLSLRGAWAFTSAQTLLQPGTYITIEQRSTDAAGGQDTGWYMVAQAFSSGAVSEALDAKGSMKYTVIGTGVLGILNDLVNWDVTPDIVSVPKRVATEVSTNLNTTTYQLLRVGTTNQYLYNWCDSPLVQIWATQFSIAGDILTSGMVLPVKNGGGSIQILGGSGEVRFNTTWFREKFLLGGLGYPLQISLAFNRFATLEDVAWVPATAGAYSIYTGGVAVTSVIEVDNSSGQIVSGENYIGRSIIVKSGSEKGERFKILNEIVGPGSYYQFVVMTFDNQIPDMATYNIQAGDTIQVTDCNLLEDALWKVLWHRGFQMRDSTKPLYCNIQPPVTPIQVQPFQYRYTDNRSQLQLCQDILAVGPPNYYLFENVDGSVTTVTAVEKPIGTWDVDITNTVATSSVDSSAYGVYTRLIQIGQDTTSFNVGLNKTYGGYSVCGAYKLTDVYGLGTTSQTIMDGWVKEIFDTDPQTPKISGTTPYNYGVLYDKQDNSTLKYLTFADTDILWIDIGRNPITGNPWLVDSFDFTSFSSFIDGTILTQTLKLSFMTELDYIALTGTLPSAIPGDTDAATIEANMLALQFSPAWKVLVDEFSVGNNGQIHIPNTQLLNGVAQFARFIKVTCGQPWFRITNHNSPNHARINLSDMKVWLSSTIVRTAELGVDAEFTTAAYISEATRLRRRSVVDPMNISLETPTACKQFAVNQLRELASEFEPHTLSVVGSMCDLHQTARWVDPQTGVETNYLIRSVDLNQSGIHTLDVIDYVNLDQ